MKSASVLARKSPQTSDWVDNIAILLALRFGQGDERPASLKSRRIVEEGHFLADVALKGWSKMIFHWRALRTTILATGSALALLAAPLGDHACAEGNLDASYTVSFGRIRVGEITAIFVLGDKEYAISAHGRAGGVMKALVDGEGSFTTRGTLTDGHPVPTKIHLQDRFQYRNFSCDNGPR